MINKIPQIKNYGIFEDFVWDTSLKDFNRYNLFYGWNGSGKSTFSSLLSELTSDNKAQLHPESEWEIDSQTGPIKQSTIDNSSINIRVFNKDFVKKNVFTENHVKGIVYLSEQKKDEKENLQQKEEILKNKRQELTKNENELNGDQSVKKKKGLKDDNAAFLSDAAKSVKASFQVIDVDDKRLLNYDKTKILAFIEKNKESLIQKSNRLSVGEIETLSKSIKPQEKDLITVSELKNYSLEQLMEIYQKVVELCNISITNKSIARLKENPTIASWVYQGLKEVHKINSERCEFCDQPIPKGRISDLNKHFSDEFEKLRIALGEIISKIDLLKHNSPFPPAGTLFDEFAKTYQTDCQDCQHFERKINQLLDNWIVVLRKKQDDPFNENLIIDIAIIDAELYKVYNKSYTIVLDHIRRHNEKLSNLQSEIEKAKSKLELHYVAEEVARYSYFTKKKREDELSLQINNCNTEIYELNNDITMLKASLSNQVVGAQEFNEMLHKFIGRQELTLESRTNGGYIVKRYGTDEAKNLSEGEKTAIGLVYFVAKLKENGNKIEDTIIVFDDPISSLDSNHLFSAKSFIKNHCEKSKQLFILTHNFWFFKIMRDWLVYKKENIKGADGKNIKDANGKNTTKDLSSIYQLNVTTDNNKRVSSIQNARKELIEYDSEYHYLFGKLQGYKNNGNLSSEDCYSIANVIRRICEAALTFKYPQIRNIKGLIDRTSVEEEVKDRLYDFLNKYSHLDRIEAHDCHTENRKEEGISVIDDVINLLTKELPEHYKNMCNTVAAN